MSDNTLDVAPFPLDEAAGDLGAHAVLALLEATGRNTDYAAVKAISGDGFKFVYDPEDVFEPMRDLCPTDFVRDVLEFFRLSGSWRVDHSLEEVDGIIKESIEAGRPVLTSNLLEVRGYQVIVGFEAGDVPKVAVRGPLLPVDLDDPGPPRWLPLDAPWDGPVSSRARWATNPVFIIEDDGSKRAPKLDDQLARAAESGMRVFETYEIPYSNSGLDDLYAARPLAGRTAAHGAEAWAVLADHIKTRPNLAESGFIWKVVTCARRLAHDRGMLAEFFERHAERATGRSAELLTRVVEAARTVASGAVELAELAWYSKASEATDEDTFQSLLSGSRALAFPIGDEDLRDTLAKAGYADRIHTHTWGDALFMEDDLRWLEMLRLVRTLTEAEAEIEGVLPRLAAG